MRYCCCCFCLPCRLIWGSCPGFCASNLWMSAACLRMSPGFAAVRGPLCCCCAAAAPGILKLPLCKASPAAQAPRPVYALVPSLVPYQQVTSRMHPSCFRALRSSRRCVRAVDDAGGAREAGPAGQEREPPPPHRARLWPPRSTGAHLALAVSRSWCTSRAEALVAVEATQALPPRRQRCLPQSAGTTSQHICTCSATCRMASRLGVLARTARGAERRGGSAVTHGSLQQLKCIHDSFCCHLINGA